MNILLATDGSEHSQRAARYVAGHAGELKQLPTVHVLNVRPSLPTAFVGKKAVEEYHRPEAEATLAAAAKQLEAAGIECRTAWKVGDVAAEVAHYVAASSIDLLVIGSHGHGVLTMTLGSNATKIIAAAKVPVLVVR